jgi:hypothetical protein
MLLHGSDGSPVVGVTHLPAEMQVASQDTPTVFSCSLPNDHMKPRILFAILIAGIGVLVAGAPAAQRNRIGPAEIYPDPTITPGAANPEVTQQNIQDNICNPHWSTKLIRPPREYTSNLKRRQLREYRDTVHQMRADLINPSTGKVDTTRCVAHSDNMACYEEDHLISLENGGNPTDPRSVSENYRFVLILNL